MNLKFNMNTIRIYSDAFSYHNGKPEQKSGYVVLFVNEKNKIFHKIFKAYEGTTNNFGELMGVLEGLNYINSNLQKFKNTNFILFSDSEYAIKGCSERIYKWSKNEWKGYDGNTIKNLNIWKSVFEFLIILARKRVPISFKWLKGHKGKKIKLEEDVDTYFQEKCDTLASKLKNSIIKS